MPKTTPSTDNALWDHLRDTGRRVAGMAQQQTQVFQDWTRPAPLPQVFHSPKEVVANPTSNFVYVSNIVGNTVAVIDTVTKRIVNQISGNFSAPGAIAITPDGARLFVANWGTPTNVINVVSTSTFEIIESIMVSGVSAELSQDMATLTITPDGSKVLISYSQTSVDKIGVIDTTSYEVVDSASNGGVTFYKAMAIESSSAGAYISGTGGIYPYNISLNSWADPGSLYTGQNYSGVVLLNTRDYLYLYGLCHESCGCWNMASTPTAGASVSTPGSTWGLMVKATDESVLYASCPGTNTVIVIDPDPDSFTVLYTIDVGTNPYGLDVTPDNAWVYVANTDDDTVSVISTATNTVVKTIGE